MENGSATQGKPRLVLLWLGSIKAFPGECRAKLGDLKGFPGKFKVKVVDVAESIKNFGHDDPRQVIIHSLKVALAVTLISLIYYVRPFYDYFGDSGMSAVITVVEVFEFTVGETLSKCLNSGFGTLLGGALGIGAAHLGSLSGEKGDPILLGIFVFLLAVSSTFLRSFTHIKRSCNYGVMTFILTFSFVSISGSRVDNILKFAFQLLLTIIIGGATSVIISIFVHPVWAGEELHKSVAHNVKKLAIYLEGFIGEDFQVSRDGYKSVIGSETTETKWESYATLEPSHGRFQFRRHPWKQYLKIGALTWHCVHLIEALNNDNINFEIQNSKKAVEDLKDLLANTSTATVASRLTNINTCVEMIVISVHELSRLAHFEGAELNRVTPIVRLCEENLKPTLDGVELNETPEKAQLKNQESVKTVPDGDSPHVVIPVHGTE
ncbi:hypothetical protein L1049_009459 [Liquidambar formosana]|uniref:Aluminum-activated malate transporter n=1 Tax=Liquidambar formosana TaxID=63359 RepID=A0AAP0SBE0_LIQFO